MSNTYDLLSAFFLGVAVAAMAISMSRPVLFDRHYLTSSTNFAFVKCKACGCAEHSP